MIRILHTIDTTGPGGAETVFVHLAKGLDSQQFRSFVAITGPGWVCDELRKNGIEPTFVQSLGGYNLRYLIELIRIIRENNIDIVQSHLLGANVYSSLAGLICRVPVVSTFHGFVDASDNDRSMPIKSRIINLGSKKIVFVSDKLREHLVRQHRFSINKAITIHNGIDTSVFSFQRDDSIRKEIGLGPEHVLIGSIGNIRNAKGYDHLLKAAAIVAKSHPECRFAIAGQGSGRLYEDLLALKSNLCLNEKVFFLGFRTDVATFLKNIDIYVLSSTSEGFSMSVVEAMAAGQPVVATLSGGPEEILTDGSGLLVAPGDDEQLAAAIISLIGDGERKRAHIRRAYEVVGRKFSVHSMIDAYKQTYYASLCK